MDPATLSLGSRIRGDGVARVASVSSSGWDSAGREPHRSVGRALRVPDSVRHGWTWVLLALFGFVLGQLFAGALVEIFAAQRGVSGRLSAIAQMAAPPEWYVISSLVGLWIGLLAATFVASRWRGTRRWLADIGVSFRPIDLIGLPIGVACQYLVAALYLPFHLQHFTAPAKKLTGSAHGSGQLLIGIATIAVAPFIEEIFFRGLLLRGLRASFATIGALGRVPLGLVVSIVADGALFGLAHGEAAQFAGLASFGVILAIISWRTGRQGMNVLAHGAFNMVAVVATFTSNGVIVH